MTQIMIAYAAESTSGDSYVGKCAVNNDESMFESLQDHLLDRFGEEYAYLDYVKLHTEEVGPETIRWLEKELTLSIQRALEAEQ